MLTGHAVISRDQVVLGAATLAGLHKRVGDAKLRHHMQAALREESLLDSLQPASVRRHPDILEAVALHL